MFVFGQLQHSRRELHVGNHGYTTLYLGVEDGLATVAAAQSAAKAPAALGIYRDARGKYSGQVDYKPRLITG